MAMPEAPPWPRGTSGTRLKGGSARAAKPPQPTSPLASTAGLWLAALLLLGLAVLGTGCEPTMYVKKGEQLIDRTPKFVGNKALDSEVLYGGVRSRPNRKVAFTRFYLTVYNIGRYLAEDSSWVKKIYHWFDPDESRLRSLTTTMMERIGEAPALINLGQIKADVSNLEKIYFSKGYLHPKVSYIIKTRRFNKKRAYVVYNIDEGPVYILRQVDYVSQDEAIEALAELNAHQSALRPGENYDEELLSGERVRITELMRNHGYFRFDPTAISYVVDTLINDPAVDSVALAKGRTLLSRLTKGPTYDASLSPKAKYFDLQVILPDTGRSTKRYSLGEISLSIQSLESYYRRDTTYFHLLAQPQDLDYYDHELGISRRMFLPIFPYHFQVDPLALNFLNYNNIAQQITIKPGDVYSRANLRLTLQKLQDMNIYRSVVVRELVNDSLRKVNILFEMPLLKRLSFNVGLDIFDAQMRQSATLINSSLPSFGGKVLLSKRNAFKRGESFNIIANGNLNLYRSSLDSSLRLFYQIGLEVNFTIPRLPVLPKLFSKATFFNPNSVYSVSFTNEARQEFGRRLFAGDWTMSWAHLPYSNRFRSVLKPLRITVVDSDTIRASFLNLVLGRDVFVGDSIVGTLTDRDLALLQFIRRDFQPRVATSWSYSFVFNDNYGLQRNRTTFMVRSVFEMGGNWAFLYDLLSNKLGFGDGSFADGLLGGKSIYAQYYSLQTEAKAYKPLGLKSELIFRMRAGVVSGWNYTKNVLLDNRFFTGGMNSVRGWASNTLGPGTSTLVSNALPVGGEILFEANLEYRRDMIGPVELALFTDVGNVWFSRKAALNDPTSVFNAPNLRLGWAAGIGFRFDFSFLIIRLDIAQQIYNPDGRQWAILPFPKALGGKGLQYNIGIGYPF